MQKSTRRVVLNGLHLRRTLYYLDSPDQSGAYAVYQMMSPANATSARETQGMTGILVSVAVRIRLALRRIIGGSTES